MLSGKQQRPHDTQRITAPGLSDVLWRSEEVPGLIQGCCSMDVFPDLGGDEWLNLQQPKHSLSNYIRVYAMETWRSVSPGGAGLLLKDRRMYDGAEGGREKGMKGGREGTLAGIRGSKEEEGTGEMSRLLLFLTPSQPPFPPDLPGSCIMYSQELLS